MFNIDSQYLYKLNSMPRGKKCSTPITNVCKVPYFALTIDYKSNCLICSCDGWLPIPVGKVQDFESLNDVWTSSTAKILQNDIDQQKFTWCAVEYCGIKNQDILPTKHMLSINIDESCNLACPSCRRDLIMHSNGPEFDAKIKDTKRILQWLEKFDEPILISLSGNGDPFASHIIRPLIQSYHPKITQTFNLQTNGLLLKKQLSTSPLLPNVKGLQISVDAGSKSIYEDVRRPGKWEVLIENFDYLASVDLCRITTLNFCLQKKNYQDLPAFASLCEKYNFRGAIHQLNDWGTWNSLQVKNPDSWTILNGTYFDQNVLDPGHNEHHACVDILRLIDKQNYQTIEIADTIKTLL